MKAGVLVHPGPLYASWPPGNFREHIFWTSGHFGE
jgi:hypothetical protein